MLSQILLTFLLDFFCLLCQSFISKSIRIFLIVSDARQVNQAVIQILKFVNIQNAVFLCTIVQYHKLSPQAAIRIFHNSFSCFVKVFTHNFDEICITDSNILWYNPITHGNCTIICDSSLVIILPTSTLYCKVNLSTPSSLAFLSISSSLHRYHHFCNLSVRYSYLVKH